jgi:hypothetical protein
MISRRSFLKAWGAATLLAGAGLKTAHDDVPVHRWDGYDFGVKVIQMPYQIPIRII